MQKKKKKQTPDRGTFNVAQIVTTLGELTQTQSGINSQTENLLQSLESIAYGRLRCECGAIEHYLDIVWEDWLSVHAHYSGCKIMVKDCNAYPFLEYYIVEEEDIGRQ